MVFFARNKFTNSLVKIITVRNAENTPVGNCLLTVSQTSIRGESSLVPIVVIAVCYKIALIRIDLAFLEINLVIGFTFKRTVCLLEIILAHKHIHIVIILMVRLICFFFSLFR